MDLELVLKSERASFLKVPAQQLDLSNSLGRAETKELEQPCLPKDEVPWSPKGRWH